MDLLGIEKLHVPAHIRGFLDEIKYENGMPHMIIYGSCGSDGPKLASEILKRFFSKNEIKIKSSPFLFTTSSGKKVEISCFTSQYHMEINPSEAGIYDRTVIQEVVSDFAKTKQIISNNLVEKVIIIHDADRLSKGAQQALRRTIEKFSVNVRVIFVATSLLRFLPAIRSRCVTIRIPMVDDSHVEEILKTRNIKPTPELLHRCNGSTFIASAILPSFDGISMESYCSCIAKSIIKEQSVKVLSEIRKQFFGLLSVGFRADSIVERLSFLFVQQTSPKYHVDIINMASEYISRLDSANKEIYHLEAFSAKIMSLLAS